MTMLAAALSFFDAGIHIAGCQGRSKIISQSSFADRDAVVSFFTNNPESNIAIRTGAVNGLLVVDVDFLGGMNPDLNGLGAFNAFEAKYGTLPATIRANTPRGGFHLYYKYVGAAPITKPRIATAIDLRGDAQYVTVPPSISTKGVPYAWNGSSLIGNMETLTEAPSWLVELGTDNWPESWPVPDFTTPYDHACWLHSMQRYEDQSGKVRANFEAADWSVVQTYFEEAVASARRWDNRRMFQIEEAVTAVDTLTVNLTVG